jgi:hypothetical protein
MTMRTDDDLPARARRLGLYGLLAHWDDVVGQTWLPDLIGWEEAERRRRGFERRLRRARLTRFKPLVDFDWNWPKKIDRAQVEELFELRFLHDAGNVILVGPNGVGKSMLAQNLAHAALAAGHTVRWVTASELLNDLAAQDGPGALQRRFGCNASLSGSSFRGGFCRFDAVRGFCCAQRFVARYRVRQQGFPGW